MEYYVEVRYIYGMPGNCRYIDRDGWTCDFPVTMDEKTARALYKLVVRGAPHNWFVMLKSINDRGEVWTADNSLGKLK